MLQMNNFISNDPNVLFGINIRSANSIKAYVQIMSDNKNEYARYTVARMGYRPELAYLAGATYGLTEVFLMQYKAAEYLCTMLNYELTGYNICIGQ